MSCFRITYVLQTRLLNTFDVKFLRMTKSKKIFAIGCAIFTILLAYASYDISRKTTFPGSKPQLPERLKHNDGKADSSVQKR